MLKMYIHHTYPNKFEGYKFNRKYQTRICIKFQYLRHKLKYLKIFHLTLDCKILFYNHIKIIF